VQRTAGEYDAAPNDMCCAPGDSPVAVLWNPEAYSKPTMPGLLTQVEAAARTLGIRLLLVPAFGPDYVIGAFAAMVSGRAGALIVIPSPLLFGAYNRIASLATEVRLPAMGAAREFADLGGLMSYRVNQVDLARQTATYVDRILKGAKPAELPVEQPIKFELVVNLKTARELGVAISSEFLQIADDVLE
jgi:putative tryptophan/tyrosine transport system substrate-binding protein